MTNLNEITYVDWQLKLNTIGGVAEGADDINQCIAIILLTKKGSVPHRPTFGSDIYKYIDYPVNEATPNIVREATDAITMWETRIKINSIEVEIEESNPHKNKFYRGRDRRIHFNRKSGMDIKRFKRKRSCGG